MRGDATVETAEQFDPAPVAVRRFADAISAEGSSASNWPQALAAMELADSIELSLKRGRMIDVHHQQLTEHLAFKGTMAALGCGVLLVVAPLLLLLSWIAGSFGLPVANYWAYLLLALLAVFLGLQFLPRLIYPRRSSDAPLPGEGVEESSSGSGFEGESQDRRA